MDKPTEFLNYLDKREFDFVRSLLAKEEIENIFSKHGPSDIDGSGFYYKIVIDEKDSNKAELIGNELKRMVNNEENESFSFCPKCDHDEIKTKKLSSAKSIIYNFKVECLCMKCGYKWYAKSNDL
jgi:hypothetical protein